MTPLRTPDWLAEFQAGFSGALRVALKSESGTFRTDVSQIDHADHLGLSTGGRGGSHFHAYNLQYWFRLFGVLQSEFPLTARILGLWSFNHVAMRYLTEHPPYTVDIAEVGSRLVSFLERQSTSDYPSHAKMAGTSWRALVQSARIDAAWRAVFLAPSEVIWRPTQDEIERFAHMTLTMSKTVALVCENWDLVELRARMVDQAGEQRVLLPRQLDAVRHRALIRNDQAVTWIELDLLEAKLLELLAQMPVNEAMQRFEGECSGVPRATLPGLVQRWIARSMQLNLWIRA